MKLVIGGYAQGKLNYVLQKYDMETSKIWDGEIPENKGEQNSIVINHLHHWIKSRIAKDGCPEEENETGNWRICTGEIKLCASKI